jgi:integrase
MLPDKLPEHVHRKRVGGRVYLYFMTGQVDEAGRDVRVRLPEYGTTAFHREYARLKDAREGRAAPEIALTVPVFCDRFRKSFGRRKKPLAAETKRSYETWLKVIEDQFDTFLAADVEPRDVLALLEKMEDRPGAANQCVRTMSAMYAWGMKPANGPLVTRNPAAGHELYEGGEHEPWPDWLLDAGLRAEDALVRLTVNLLYYGGQRIGDTASMPWRKIAPECAFMSVKQEKTGEELDIQIHRDLRAILRAMPRTLGTVITKPDGSRYSVGYLRKRLTAWAAERGAEVVPHGLRKNAVNGLLEAGCTAAEVSSITGQSLQMVEHYAKKRDRKKLSGSAMRKWENAG